MTSYDDELGVRLLATVARVNRWATKHADLPIPPAQARLLALIQELGRVRIGELAAADHCSQPTMTTQVQRLEAAGLIERTADPADGRATLVALTDEGQQVLSEARSARSRSIAPELATLSRKDRQALDKAVAILDEMVPSGARTDDQS